MLAGHVLLDVLTARSEGDHTRDQDEEEDKEEDEEEEEEEATPGQQGRPKGAAQDVGENEGAPLEKRARNDGRGGSA